MTLPDPSASSKVRQYPCPGCSAELVFEPKNGRLTCPYCGREEEIPASASAIQERSYQSYLDLKPERFQTVETGVLEVHCQQCGASVVFQPPLVAGHCDFCGSPLVAQPSVPAPVLAPESVLPFAFPQSRAAESIKSWLASRWFAPNSLVHLARQEIVSGVYLPYWTFDAHTLSYYEGERGDYYWESETYSTTDEQGRSVTRTRQVRRTAWRPASGQVERWFDDVLIPATRSIPTARVKALEPWDLVQLKPYQGAYLSGFKAQRYQVDPQAGFEEAKQEMSGVISGDIRRDIGGDEQRIHQVSTSYTAITFKHLLLPVWISAYRFRDQGYQVIVNAQTGEVQGDRPYSPLKIVALVVILAFVLMLLIFFSQQN
ncbi:MAG: hypothetical protein U0V70_04745 [Terriglobia bacterium]